MRCYSRAPASRPRASERIACAACAVRNQPNRPLLSFTHITAGPSHICEMLELCAAPGASGSATDPLIHEGLPTDVDTRLGPRPKLCGGHHATRGVGGNRSECKATVANLCNLQLTRVSIAAQRDHLNRRALDAARDSGFEDLQCHRIDTATNRTLPWTLDLPASGRRDRASDQVWCDKCCHHEQTGCRSRRGTRGG